MSVLMDDLMNSSTLAMVALGLAKHREGVSNFGIYAVCSSQPQVLQAALRFASEQGSLLLIESSSNQVNHLGGYTGMQPADFIEQVRNYALARNFPQDKLIFGGDHLGPFPWRKEPAAVAMAQAGEMVKAYIEAGYQKIHIDTSSPCSDDTLPLTLELMASRAGELCRIAEQAAAKVGSRPYYVLGSEVPSPGRTDSNKAAMQITSLADLNATVACFEANLSHLWPRVLAFVVQPGVEFGEDSIHYYQHRAAASLSANLQTMSGRWVFEVHSSDYQGEERLHTLVQDHFAILKVGPALTFAYREALFALAMAENLLYHAGKLARSSKFIERLTAVLLADDRYWRDYYNGDEDKITFALFYSLNDRIRYYWNSEAVATLVEELLSNLKDVVLPFSLLSQFFPELLNEIPAALATADELIYQRIARVLSCYHRACFTEV